MKIRNIETNHDNNKGHHNRCQSADDNRECLGFHPSQAENDISGAYIITNSMLGFLLVFGSCMAVPGNIRKIHQEPNPQKHSIPFSKTPFLLFRVGAFGARQALSPRRSHLR